MAKKKDLSGIEIRHRKACTSRSKTAFDCACRPSFRPSVFDERTQKLVRGTTCRELDAAISWRVQKIAALQRGERHRDDATKVAAAGVELLARMESGVELTRSGTRYKPATIRGCEQALRNYIVPALGTKRVVDLHRADVQDVVDALMSDGCRPSTVRNALLPLRLICRRALRRGTLIENPMLGLSLPAVGRGRDRIASRDEAIRLLAAVSDADARIWATALYAGLRYGELRALLVEDVDLSARLIHVRAGWDPKSGRQLPKSAAGVRSVPIIGRLQPYLEAVLSERSSGLVFGVEPEVPFQSQSVQDRADKAGGLPASPASRSTSAATPSPRS
ncbi:MAG TPA: hypothetical protein VN238_12760 [Solirubrobacteraceae bacterium]|nr:hypothetical protein [Solirubrobacteraceae bacterium]